MKTLIRGCCARSTEKWTLQAKIALVVAAHARLALAPSALSVPIPMHSVSGFSSGGTIAVNHGVAFSSSVRGIGVLGGSPYGCDILPDGSDGDYTTCSYWTANVSRSAEWLSRCDTYLRARAQRGVVDALGHLANKPVYLFSGTRDSMVWQRTMRAVEEQFRGLGAHVYSRFDIAAEHAWIVDNATCNRPNVPTLDSNGLASTLACCGAHPDLFGQCVLPNVSAAASGDTTGAAVLAEFATPPTHGCCGACAAGFCEPGAPPDGDCPPGVPPTPLDGPPWWLPPINNCEYDMAGDMLQFLHSTRLLKRERVIASHLLAFSQAEYIPKNLSLDQAAMDGTGFVYVPAVCNATVTACEVHVHYHPCGGNWQETSLGYMLGSGKAAYAESNRLILLYPQASVAGPWGGDCWDWAGSATGPDFDTRHGVQLTAVRQMLGGLEELVRGGRPMPSEWPPGSE